jgi:single-stranded DNA-specific DHH superfamily exonuclease
MKITFNQAREFLEVINENDRVAIFTHRDLDGMAAGILFSDFCKKRKAKVKTWILDCGTNRMSNYKLKMYNKILISDLAPNIVFQDLVGLGNKKVFYTDHHPEENESPIQDYVLELRTTTEGYFPSTRTVYELTEQENKDKLWLATLGTLSDMAEKYPENKEFLENAYKQLGLTQKDMMKYLFKFNFALIGSSSMEKSFKEISKLSRLGDIAKLAKYYEPVEREFQRVTEDYNVNR